MEELQLEIPLPEKREEPKKKIKKEESKRGCVVVDHSIETVSADDYVWLMWGDK